MEIRKQADGNIRVTLTEDELYNALEAESGDAKFESLISETAGVKSIAQYGGKIEIVWGE
jgi:hypothetical protein